MNSTKNVIRIVMVAACVGLLFCCELLDGPKLEIDKRIETLTEGGPWKVDSLVYIEEENSGVPVYYVDTVYLNYGTMEFKAPSDPKPGYGAGFVYHRYTKNGKANTDTLAWKTYDDIAFVTIYYPTTGQIDYVAGAYDQMMDILGLESKKAHFGGWRRKSINGTNSSYGIYRRYYLTR